MGFRHINSLDQARIQPVVVQECVPNDIINLDLKAFVTSAPNVAPLQGKYIMHMAAFFVPNRVVFEKWTEYITGTSNYALPFFLGQQLEEQFAENNNPDYIGWMSGMGLNPTCSYHYYNGSSRQQMKLSIIPFRAYRRIWWDWFRNPSIIPDTQESSYIFKGVAGTDLLSNYGVHYANWSKDYLTNNLRTPHGDSRVTAVNPSSVSTMENTGSRVLNQNANVGPSIDGVSDGNLRVSSADNAGQTQSSNVTAFRLGVALENWLLRGNILGGRIIDKLRGMFGASASAEVMQMSEYLGENSFDLSIENEASSDSSTNNVESQPDFNAFGTTNTADANMKGQLSGRATSTTNGLSNINYHCKEHGTFMVVAWIMPDVLVDGGIPRIYTRGVDGPLASVHEFYDESFADTGVDSLILRDINLPYKMGDDSASAYGDYSPYKVIGYRGKYEDYRYNKDIVGGCFVDPNTRTSMAAWLLRRDLNVESTQCDQAFEEVSNVGEAMAQITHDSLPSWKGVNKAMFDYPFTVNSLDLDHFVCDFRVGLTMTRPITSLCAPRIETASKTAVEFNGNRL